MFSRLLKRAFKGLFACPHRIDDCTHVVIRDCYLNISPTWIKKKIPSGTGFTYMRDLGNGKCMGTIYGNVEVVISFDLIEEIK